MNANEARRIVKKAEEMKIKKEAQAVFDLYIAPAIKAEASSGRGELFIRRCQVINKEWSSDISDKQRMDAILKLLKSKKFRVISSYEACGFDTGQYRISWDDKGKPYKVDIETLIQPYWRVVSALQ
jgi:hypothetical protein